MFKQTLNFIKYNNITVLILAAILLIGSGVFAQTEAGQVVIGSKETRLEGVDNTLLVAADLDNFVMDYKIERIEADDPLVNQGQGYYYATYTYLDLVKEDSAWQYQMQEKTRKVSFKLKDDLGKYLAKELAEERDARLKELKTEQAKASSTGEVKRMEVTDYSGLVGRTLDLASRIFPGYEPVRKREIPSPALPLALVSATGEDAVNGPDNLTDIFNQYVEQNDPDRDNFFGALDNCPATANSDQADSDNDGLGDACDLIDPSAPSGQATDASTTIATTTTETEAATPEPPSADTGEAIAPATPADKAPVEVIELP